MWDHFARKFCNFFAKKLYFVPGEINGLPSLSSAAFLSPKTVQRGWGVTSESQVNAEGWLRGGDPEALLRVLVLARQSGEVCSQG